MRFLGRKRVLVLDDDPAMQRLVTTLLKRDGRSVDVVSKGQQAIEAIERNRYDALLLDLMMPTEGGMTVIRHLKEKNPALLKRVLLVTGTPDSVVRTIVNDVAGVVKKPFEPAELLASVKKLVD